MSTGVPTTGTLHSLDRVRTFCTGIWGKGTKDEEVCTLHDLQDVVRNFQRLSTGNSPLHEPAIAKGHEIINGEPGPDLSLNTGEPACGWIKDCWLEGNWLWTKWAEIPDPVWQQIQSGEYRFLSPEFYPHPSKGDLPGDGWCLRQIAILGATPPRNKFLGRIIPVKTFCEDLRFTRAKRYSVPGSTRSYIKFFSEGVPMDRKALEEQLRGIGYNDAQIEALSGLPDDAFSTFVLATLAAQAGAGAAPAAAPAATTNADMPPVEQMIAELQAAGVPQAEIDACGGDPAALYALWQAKVQVNMSEPTQPQTTPTSVGAPLPKKVVTTFAEMQRDFAGMKRELTQLRVERQRERFEKKRENDATRKRTVESLKDRWVKEEYATPGEMDPGSKTVNTYQELMAADGGNIKKFGEQSLSEFDAKVQAIEARGPGYVRKFFSEKIADPANGKGGELERVRAAAKAYAAARNGKKAG